MGLWYGGAFQEILAHGGFEVGDELAEYGRLMLGGEGGFGLDRFERGCNVRLDVWRVGWRGFGFFCNRAGEEGIAQRGFEVSDEIL